MLSPISNAPDLIRTNAAHGYPPDYLLARVKGRRAALIDDWTGPTARNLAARWSDDQIWETLLIELAWLHRQLDDRWRRTLSPVFVVFEIKTIVLCLRNKALQRDEASARLLARSLMAAEITRALRNAPDVGSAVAAVTAALASHGEGFARLPAAYAADNLKGLENSLMRACLEYAARGRLHPAVKTFVTGLIDLRNAMLLYKHRRWSLDGSPAFITGGTVPASRLDRLLPPAAGAIPVETALLRRLTVTLDRQRRMSDVGVLVAYIWRLYVQARNLAILHHGAELDEATLDRELIQ